jgi:hypothetical protein
VSAARPFEGPAEATGSASEDEPRLSNFQDDSHNSWATVAVLLRETLLAITGNKINTIKL